MTHVTKMVHTWLMILWHQKIPVSKENQVCTELLVSASQSWKRPARKKSNFNVTFSVEYNVSH